MTKPRYNPNIMGLVLVLVAFLWSALHVAQISLERLSESQEDGKRIIRLLHWQLEPGYREALDRQIDRYNNLPKVKAANVEVRQMAISYKVYPQFINVHLISGTAPDLSVRGATQLVNTANTGMFYEPISQWITQPNPYNIEPFLPPDLSPDIERYVKTAPWRETFVDGMRSGYDWNLKDFFSVPISTFGSNRIYYNKRIMAEAKALLREALGLSPPERPEWFTSMILESPGGKTGYLPLNDRLLEWAATDDPPVSLGQFFLVAEAIREHARQVDDERLVPIAISAENANMIRDHYLPLFTYHLADRLQPNRHTYELWDTFLDWQTGRWSFEDPAVKGFFEFIRALTQYLPIGFQGLDRDQANRRFVLGRAGMIPGGGFDAVGIHQGASNKADPADAFEVGVIPFPMPAEGERWYDLMDGPKSETGTFAVSFALYKKSQNKEWAMDFLQFLTSVQVNEDLNVQAGWLPMVVGADPSALMAPFMPNPRGIGAGGLNFGTSGDAPANQITTIFKGNFWLYGAGDMTYEQFTGLMAETIENPQVGVRDVWKQQFILSRDDLRARERALSAIEAVDLLLNDEETGIDNRRYRIVLYDSIRDFGGNRLIWQYENRTGEGFPDKERLGVD